MATADATEPRRDPAKAADPKRVLVVEDEYMIAQDMVFELTALGVEVVGPVGTVDLALRLAEAEARLDAAFLDINLNGERTYRVADILIARGIPVVFTTGYDENVIPPRYADVPRCGKPVTKVMLRRMLDGDRVC
jgi:CheY-like chemotaxis protein